MVKKTSLSSGMAQGRGPMAFLCRFFLSLTNSGAARMPLPPTEIQSIVAVNLTISKRYNI